MIFVPEGGTYLLGASESRPEGFVCPSCGGSEHSYLTVYTDELKSYSGLDQNYVHKVINHAERFVGALSQTPGRRVTWKELTDKTPAERTPPPPPAIVGRRRVLPQRPFNEWKYE